DAFAAAATAHVEPPELIRVPRPRIGYVGAINDKLDVSLLAQVSEAYPKASLLLVGPERPWTPEMRRGLERLHQMRNVFMLGQMPVERVPEFVAACDVGLLPYRRNRWTEHIHPLKLYEYLACGLPVVATDIPSVRDEADVVTIAANAGDFVAAVAAALADDDAQARARRQARAAQNTWRHRVERISELIEAGLDRAG
ncbi:MAG: glycosyltransferase, partial [Clostridia bacterium]|nr:glycosyltransferase [Clostridia bacterium]